MPPTESALVQAGQPLEKAHAAIVMVHGRGATAESILELADVVGAPGVAYLAPQAPGNTWYPNRFLAPIESNEPWLSTALSTVGSVLERVAGSGVPLERAVLLGFSQGACLALEYAARNPRRYGGLVGLSGGLIGPLGTTWDHPARLDGTPTFLGCSDVDAHIPMERVEESARVLTGLGAEVTARIYPRMGHTVNNDELEWVRELVATLAST